MFRWPVVTPPVFALDNFEGPLDLLLSLIEQKALDISVVSLAAVTNQYLAYINAGLPLDLAADYLRIAARLVWIKSVGLLPRQVAAVVDEPVEEVESAEDLAAQLREYARFKAAAEFLRSREEGGFRSWPRRVPPTAPRLRPLSPIPLDKLVAAVLAVVNRMPPVDPRSEPVPRIPLAERILDVEARVRNGAASLADLMPADPPISLIVVTFLAILELFRRGTIEVVQSSPFGGIDLRMRIPLSNRDSENN